MSAVVKLVKSIVSDVVDSIVSVLTVAWVDVLQPILKTVAGYFGIKDKDVIHTNVNSQRIITSNTVVKDTKVKLALSNQKDNSNSVISKLIQVTSTSRGRYNEYYEKGKNDYIDGLPTVQIKNIYVNTAEVKKVIDAAYSINATISYADIHIPTKDEYVAFTLQSLYSYQVWTNTLKYENKYGLETYELDSSSYNYSNNNYDINISAYETHTTTNSTKTEIIITNIDSNHDNEETKVYNIVLVVGSVTGTISNTSTSVSDTNTTIDKDSESNSTTTVVNSTTYKYHVLYDTKSFSISSYLPNLDYVVKYYTNSASEWKYWIYDETTNNYPNLTYNFSTLTHLDMLPVITVRNNFVNTNSNSKSTRCIESQRMMHILGLNLDTFTNEINKNPDIDKVADVFIHFGLSFTETEPLASKVFFDMFNTILPNTAGGSKYSITFKEGPMNMAIAWTDMTSIIHNGIIGELGHADHNVTINGSDAVVTIRKQTGPEQYTEITMHNMSNVTFIHRNGLWGTVNVKADSKDFILPLSKYHVSKYSGLEQIELMALSLRTTQYAAVIQHIKWYQTGVFAIFLDIIAVAIVIIGCITAACSPTALAVALVTMVATSIALKWVFEHTHNPWLRGLAVVAAVITGSEANAFAKTGQLLSATQLLDSVTQFAVTDIALGINTISSFVSIYTEDQLYKLEGRKTAFDRELDKRVKALKEKQREIASKSKVTVQNVTNLVTKFNPIDYYKTTSPAYMIYSALDIQYDFGILYDYDIIVKDFYKQKLSLS